MENMYVKDVRMIIHSIVITVEEDTILITDIALRGIAIVRVVGVKNSVPVKHVGKYLAKGVLHMIERVDIGIVALVWNL